MGARNSLRSRNVSPFRVLCVSYRTETLLSLLNNLENDERVGGMEISTLAFDRSEDQMQIGEMIDTRILPDVDVILLSLEEGAADRYRDYCSFIGVAGDWLIRRDQSRLYVVADEGVAAHEVNLPELTQANLREWVQMPEAAKETAWEIPRAFWKHFENVDDIRDEGRKRLVRFRITQCIGLVCGAVKWGLTAAAIVLFVMSFSMQPATSSAVFGLVAGVYLPSAFAIVIWSWRWKFPVLVLWAFVAIVFVFGVFSILDAPEWVLNGFVLGIGVDIAHRIRLQGGRAYLRVAHDGSRHYWLPRGAFRDTMSGIAVGWPFGAPWLHSPGDRIFISYAHSSQWSTGMAVALRESLDDPVYREIFFDRDSIDEGSSWCHELNRGLSECNVFIAFIDESASTKSWPAAELETVMFSRFATGTPNIIVVLSPSCSLSQSVESRDMTRESIFVELLEATRHSERSVTVIQVKEETRPAEVVAELKPQIHPYRFVSQSIAPRWLSDILLAALGFSGLALWVTLPYSLLGSLVAIPFHEDLLRSTPFHQSCWIATFAVYAGAAASSSVFLSLYREFASFQGARKVLILAALAWAVWCIFLILQSEDPLFNGILFTGVALAAGEVLIFYLDWLRRAIFLGTGK